MDNLAHSLVGLTSAKAGLERLSPCSTAVCIASANAADADFLSLFFGDRWTLLQHHRGITHSIIGTIAIGLLIPTLALAIERIVTTLRGRRSRIQFRGLLIASMISAATHPLMDWTNNYGVRPLLPWSSKWFYGDLVFIVDPYMWLVLGGAMFLLTSHSKPRTIAWTLLGSCVTALIVIAGRSRGASAAVTTAIMIWIVGLALLIGLRIFGVPKRAGRVTAVAALMLIATYWGALAWMHRSAYGDAVSVGNAIAAQHSERLLRVAAMPAVATPFTWQCVAETDQAMYRFIVVNGESGEHSPPSRYEKLTGQNAQLVSLAERDRRAQVLLGFARFPIERVNADNCVHQALVQFADLRYTEPGAAGGNFSVSIPVDCPSR
jgi:inner membrane protein